ncbi:MAG TPA: hypothetical protein VFC44_00715 [Candidatus Saccharimonadales bacterium]|nr:hypothetical protein [Candidatus Saccharimonadales bacterium]
MQGERLRNLLLNHPLVDGRPLFPNAAAIASKLTEQPLNTRKPRSVISLLSATFSNIRGFSMDFRSQLIQTVSSALMERKLPPEVARDFVGRLDKLIARHNTEIRGGGPELPDGVDAVPEEIRLITKFFNDLGEQAGLLCCEYRDPPRIYGPVKYSGLMQQCAQAIVRGASFAMFLPFVADSQYPHAPCLHAFFKELEGRLEYGARELLKACQELEPDEARRAALPSRIALYKIGKAYDAQFVTGIQSRTFLSYCHAPSQELMREAWEWVAGGGRDYFLQRDAEIVPLLSAQFDPIAFYWHSHGVLPKTPAEVTESITMFNELYRANLPTDLWTIHPN